MNTPSTPGYLLDGRKPKGAYHRWTGQDTACRMWSTGGLKQSKPSWVFVSVAPPVRSLCHMCRVNAKISEAA